MSRANPQFRLIFFPGSKQLTVVLAETLPERVRVLKTAQLNHTNGFQKGEVAALDEALSSVQELIKKLSLGEETAEIPVYVLLSNPTLKMTGFSSAVYYSAGRTIHLSDIRQVIDQTRGVAPLPLEDWILEALPESYQVNDVSGVEDPLGLEAQRLAVTLQIFTTKYAPFRNLARLMESLELNIRGYVPQTLALPQAFVNSDGGGENLILDLSDDACHLILTKEGKISRTRSFGPGINFFSEKIAEHWKLGKKEASRLRGQFGSLERETKFGDELIPLNEKNNHPQHQIRRGEFHQFFLKTSQDYLEGLAKQVQKFLEESRCGHPVFVVTGDGTRLEGMVERLAEKFNFPIRVGAPRYLEGAGAELGDPSLSGLVGMLHWMNETQDKPAFQASAKTNFLEKTLGQVRSWLTAYF